jgi:O-antigen/teichoic acid export membrane protein
MAAARGLGAAGRGEVVAAQICALVGVWIFSMGAAQTVAFFTARLPSEAPRLIASWLIIALALAAGCTVVAELVLPLVLAHQTNDTLQLARVFTPPMVFLGIYAEVAWGALLGLHDYRYYNRAHAAPPILVAASYSVAALLGRLTVATALISFGIAYGGVAAAAVLRTVRKVRPSTPDGALARASLSFGAKAHGMNLGQMVSARLDLLMLPAFVIASSVGIYAVATNVSWLVVGVTSSLAAIVLPAAAAAGQRAGTVQVLSVLRATLAVAASMAVVIAVVAPEALTVAYGASFALAAAPLRLLLPGSVLMAGSAVLASGLCALNRPASAAISQAPGLLITLVGLPIFLPMGGIVAAALVSSVAYATSFATGMALYRKATRCSVSDIMPSRHDLALLCAPLRRLRRP